MKRLSDVFLWQRNWGATLIPLLVLALTWVAVAGFRERYAALVELGEQQQRLTQAVESRETRKQELLEIRRLLEPLPTEVPAQQEPEALIRAVWAEVGQSPPLEFKLERPEMRLGIIGLSVLSFTVRARVEDDQLDAFLQPLETHRGHIRPAGLTLRPIQGPAMGAGQVEVVLHSTLLLRRTGGVQ